MATYTTNSERKLSIEKSSKRAAWLTLIGVLFVAASLLFSFYQLHKLDKDIAEKQKQSAGLDQKLDDKQRELDYREEQVRERQKLAEKYEQTLAQLIESVPKDTLDQSIKENPQIKQVVEEVKNAPPTQPISNTQPTKDKATALAKEREGFQALISGDYGSAIAAFQAAENSYNSFHNVYELTRLLRKNRAQMSDPMKRKEVFQTIVKQYSFGAPTDLWPQVVSIANQ